jgi:hypothetical protein
MSAEACQQIKFGSWVIEYWPPKDGQKSMILVKNFFEPGTNKRLVTQLEEHQLVEALTNYAPELLLRPQDFTR